MNKQDLNKKQIEAMANAIIAELKEAGLTPDQMLDVIRMAREKFNQRKPKC